MRIAALADLHGYLPEVEDVDVCVIAGDIVSAVTKEQEGRQMLAFGHWLTKLVQRGIIPIGVAGNHDFILQDHPDFARKLPWMYLCDESIEVGGKIFHGTPWQPYFGGWAFNAPPEHIIGGGEEFLREKFQQIPDKTDVLIAHGPPAGFHDRVGGKNVGSLALNERIQQVMPTLAVYGHIHHGYGVEHVEGVTLANVAVTEVVDGQYVLTRPATYFEI